MRKEQLFEVLSCLRSANREDLYIEVQAAMTLPSANKPPNNLTKRAEKLWHDHVWPKYQKAIKKGGADAKQQWARAVRILKFSAKKRGIPVWGSV